MFAHRAPGGDYAATSSAVGLSAKGARALRPARLPEAIQAEGEALKSAASDALKNRV